MITTVTGKNQISIPAEVAQANDIRPGCRFEWEQGPRPNTLVITIHPDPSSVARSLRGRGRAFLKPGQSAVEDLIQTRRAEDRLRP